MTLTIASLRRLHLSLESLVVDAGDRIAVTGPSGSGKSQLLRAIADLDPNDGDITLDGASRAAVPGPTWRHRAGYVPATPAWWAETVKEHFDGPLDPKSLAALVLPDDCPDWPVARLSTGESVRLALLRALDRRPRLLLLDEPTGPLDAEAARAVEALLEDFCKDGGILLFTSHDPAQVERLRARTLVIRADGSIAEPATVAP